MGRRMYFLENLNPPENRLNPKPSTAQSPSCESQDLLESGKVQETLARTPYLRGRYALEHMKDPVSFERGTPWGMLIYNDFESVCCAEFLQTFSEP